MVNLWNKSSIFVHTLRFIINGFISYAYWLIVYFNNELISYSYFYLSFTLCIVVREDLQVITSPFVTNNIDLFHLIFFVSQLVYYSLHRNSTSWLFVTYSVKLLVFTFFFCDSSKYWQLFVKSIFKFVAI